MSGGTFCGGDNHAYDTGAYPEFQRGATFGGGGITLAIAQIRAGRGRVGQINTSGGRGKVSNS